MKSSVLILLLASLFASSYSANRFTKHDFEKPLEVKLIGGSSKCEDSKRVDLADLVQIKYDVSFNKNTKYPVDIGTKVFHRNSMEVQMGESNRLYAFDEAIYGLCEGQSVEMVVTQEYSFSNRADYLDEYESRRPDFPQWPIGQTVDIKLDVVSIKKADFIQKMKSIDFWNGEHFFNVFDTNADKKIDKNELKFVADKISETFEDKDRLSATISEAFLKEFSKSGNSIELDEFQSHYLQHVEDQSDILAYNRLSTYDMIVDRFEEYIYWEGNLYKGKLPKKS